MSEVFYPIRVLAQRTGLSSHVIRMWERRYGALTPQRSETNRRLYTEGDLQRLVVLQKLVDAGHRIGMVAKLSQEELEQLAREEFAARPIAPRGGGDPVTTASDEEYIEQCVRALQHYEVDHVSHILERALAEKGMVGVLQHVLAPLIEKIGQMWREGSLKIAHEHMATALIRDFLLQHNSSYALNGSAPRLVVATPLGQLHELGALLVAAGATSHGWKSIYLGTSLPAEEIAGVVKALHAPVVALSLVYPEIDARLEDELTHLRRLLPEGTSMMVGGRAVFGFHAVLEKIDASVVESLPALYKSLDRVRSNSPQRELEGA